MEGKPFNNPLKSNRIVSVPSIPQEDSRVHQIGFKWKLLSGFVPKRTVVQIKDHWHSVVWKRESPLMNDLNMMMNIQLRVRRGGLIEEIASETSFTS
jgi:hypothetical protein